MFRMKKPSGGEAQETTGAERSEAAEEEPPVKAPVRRPAAVPARPLGGPSFPIDLPRRDIGVASPLRGEPTPAVTRDKSIVIGKDVRLQGEVTACDRIIVEGEVDLKVTGCRALQIGPTGVFRGTADVGEADVAGTFAGDLSTRERLAVRATGRLEGRFRYGQITIDAGGQIVGELCTSEVPASPTDETRPSPATPTAASAGGASGAPVRVEAGPVSLTDRS